MISYSSPCHNVSIDSFCNYIQNLEQLWQCIFSIFRFHKQDVQETIVDDLLPPRNSSGDPNKNETIK